MTMKLKPTRRGFLRGEFSDLYGAKCSLQKSSLATADAIWLGVNEVELKVLVPGQGWTEVPVPDGTTRGARMHLDRKLVLELLPQLQHFAETGELLNRTTPTHEYCDDCDGCGWVEGGQALQTTCKTCKGKGILKLKKAKAK